MKIRSRILLPLAPALLGLPGVVLAASPARDPRVEIVTDMGTIVVQLAPSRAPRTVENFLRYVREGHYAGTVFHRVIQGFMIQGGGFINAEKEKIEAKVENGVLNIIIPKMSEEAAKKAEKIIEIK